VLAVDDDPDIRTVLRDYLAKNDIRVTAVASGREMFEAFESEAIDLVLLDVRMPGENGMVLARELRERGIGAGDAAHGQRGGGRPRDGPRARADDYVTKPFSPRELLARIRAVLRRYQVTRRRRRATTSAALTASPAGS
jgi:DNA-binding response OmpR family regulator